MNNAISAEPFDPVRERYGAAFEDFIRDKVAIVGGDVAETNLGFTEEEAERVASDIDVIINSAGNVTSQSDFRECPAHQRRRHAERDRVCQRMKRPALVHISTVSWPEINRDRYGG